MKKIDELEKQRAAIGAEARSLMGDDPSKMTEEQRTKFDDLMKQSDSIKDSVVRLRRSEELEKELRSGNPNVAEIDGSKINNKSDWEQRADRYRQAFWNSLRFAVNASEFRKFSNGLSGKGRARMISLEDHQILHDSESSLAASASSFDEFRNLASDPETRADMRARVEIERRDLGIGSPTASLPTSVIVPQGFYDALEIATKYYGPMMSTSTILRTATGQPLPYPTANDTAQVATIIGEGAQVSEEDVTLSNLSFGAYKYTSGMVKVSLELLQDSAFDLEGYLRNFFALRFGRGLNTHFTTGTGSSQPHGILTQATAGPTAVGSSGNTGGSETGGTSIGSDDLIALEHSVDPTYRNGAGFQMNDSTLAKLRSLKDKYGRILFPGLSADVSANKNLLGYPVYINNDLPSIAVNAKTVLFGQLNKYLVRSVKDFALVRLVERFADFGQVAFLGFARYDGNLLDAGTHPVKYLVQAAT